MIKCLESYMDPNDQSSQYFTLLQANPCSSQNHHFSLNGFFDNPNLPNTQIHVPVHTISPNTSSLSNDHSQLDHNQETDYHQHQQYQRIIDERRIRRMVSNRESARRSRIRKKKQIEELQLQVDQLMKLNHQLSEKVITLLETNQQILQENAQLKEKVSSFHVLMADTIIIPKRNVEEISAGDMNHVRVEASNQPNNY